MVLAIQLVVWGEGLRDGFQTLNYLGFWMRKSSLILLEMGVGGLCGLQLTNCMLQMQVIIHQYNQVNIHMRVSLWCCLLVLVSCQVSPTWLESAYVETKVVYLVDNHQKTSGTYFQNSTYTKPLTNPQVCLSIVQLKIVSDTNSIGFRSTISAFFSDRFTHKLQVFSPTQMWHLQLRYMAYDNNVALLQGLQIAFYNFSTSTINTGSGSVRTQTQTTAISSVTTTNSFAFGTFLAGYTGTSNDYYQANITTSITAATTLQISITVTNDTLISHMTVYVILADLTDLAVESLTFVQEGLMQSTYGNQYSYFTPTAFFDDNYISGLKSFSMRDDIEFNLTINNITYLTSETSYYDDVSCFNLYARECTAPHTYYNKVDGLCYTECPDTTYPVEAYLICQACDYTCATCTQNSTCDTCQPNRSISSGTCACNDYYYEYNQNCRACHHSCLTCQHSGQYYNCLSCDTNMKRTYNSGAKTCPCNSGYEDIEVTRCHEICGDGLRYEDACDDGNTVNGDGCSSTCIIEDYFTCDSSAPSNCYFVANLTISINKTEKQPYSNIAYFYVNVEPYIDLMSQLTTANLGSNVTLTSTSVYTEEPLLVLRGVYSSDIESTYVRIDLNKSSSGYFSAFGPVNVTFVATSNNGLPIKVWSDWDYVMSARIAYGYYVVGWIAFALAFLFCWHDWKQLGSELYFCIQFSFMSYIIMTGFTPWMIGAGSGKYLMGYNDIAGQDTTVDLNRRVMEHMGYSVGFWNNFNLMVFIQTFALVMYGVYRIGLKIHQKKQLEDPSISEFETTNYGKFLSMFSFDFFAYWAFFSMNQILIGTVVQGENLAYPAIFAYIALCLVLIVIAIAAVFVRPKSMRCYRKVLFHSNYGNRTFLFMIVGMLVMNCLLLLGVLVVSWIFYICYVVPVCIIAYVAIRRPFRSHWNNIRLILLEVSLLVVFILITITLNPGNIFVYYFPIGILVCIIFSIVVTLTVWIYLIVMKCRQAFSEDPKVNESDYSSKNEEILMKKKMREADYSYHYAKSSVRNQLVEMTEAPHSGRKQKASLLTQTTGKKKNFVKKQPNSDEDSEFKMDDISKVRKKKMSEYVQANQPRSKSIMKSHLGQDEKKKGSVSFREDKSEDDDLKLTKRKRNLYEDILKSKLSPQ